MDYKFIILAIVGIIIAYIIYSYYFGAVGNNLTDKTYYLINENKAISFNTLGSTVYTSNTITFYSWIYVNSPPTNNTNVSTGISDNQKYLFYMNGIAGSNNSPTPESYVYYGWALDQTGQNLYVYYNNNASITATSRTTTLKIVKALENIPIQSWVFIAVVLDNTTASQPSMDVYMNGKLTNSIVLDNSSGQIYVPPIPPTGMSSSTITSTATAGLVAPSPNANAIQFGKVQDIFLSNLTVVNSALRPNDIQKAYLSFAGKQNSVANGKLQYGISLVKGSGKNMLSNDFQIW
jgi:hypothetical protein